MAQTPIRVALLVLVLVSLGCETLDEPPPPDRKDIKPTDHYRPNPGFSGTWQVVPADDSRRQGVLDLVAPAAEPAAEPGAEQAEAASAAEADAPKESTPPRPRRRRAEGVLSIDADYRASLGGQDEEDLPGPDYVRWDGIQIRPSQRLRLGFDQHMATLDVRGGGRFFDVFSIEGLGGLTLSSLHVTVRGTGIRSGDTVVGVGPNIGARVSVSPHAILNLYAQGQLHLLGVIAQDHDTAVARTAEVGGQLHLTSALSVFGGYRWSGWEETIHRSSDIEMVLSGPTFGVLLRQ